MKRLARTIRSAGRWDSDPAVIHRGASARPAAAQLARGLGWFSIAIGLAELLAPRPLARALGMRNGTGLVRGYGLRELASGVAVLSVDPRTGLWSRVGGDAIDLATLGLLARRGGRARRNIAIAVVAVAGVAVLDAWAAQSLQRRMRRRGPVRDYGNRSGFARPAESMRGAASDFAVPAGLQAALPRPQPSAAAGSDPHATH